MLAHAGFFPFSAFNSRLPHGSISCFEPERASLRFMPNRCRHATISWNILIGRRPRTLLILSGFQARAGSYAECHMSLESVFQWPEILDRKLSSTRQAPLIDSALIYKTVWRVWRLPAEPIWSILLTKTAIHKQTLRWMCGITVCCQAMLKWILLFTNSEPTLATKNKSGLSPFLSFCRREVEFFSWLQ